MLAEKFVEKFDFVEKMITFFSQKYKLSETESELYAIVESMIGREDTEYMTSPLSSKFYVSNRTLQYYIMITQAEIKIANHTFSYYYLANPSFSQILINLVKDKMEEHRNQFEAEVFKNELDMLRTIKGNIQNRTSVSKLPKRRQPVKPTNKTIVKPLNK